MNQELGPERAGLDRLRRRVAALRSLLALTLAMAAALAAWSVIQGIELGAAKDQAGEMGVRIRRLESESARAALDRASTDRRLAAVEERVRRMRGGVRSTEVAALRDWGRRLERELDATVRRLDSLDREIAALRATAPAPAEGSERAPSW